MSADDGLTSARPNEATGNLGQGRLSGAVGAKQADKLRLAYVERYIAQSAIAP